MYLPQLRYDPVDTNSIYLNSITSVYKEDSLKLEVITGREDFISAYTILTIEFENLKGETTGKIEIPAEEVNKYLHIVQKCYIGKRGLHEYKSSYMTLTL